MSPNLRRHGLLATRRRLEQVPRFHLRENVSRADEEFNAQIADAPAPFWVHVRDAGRADKVITQETAYITHTNADTGYSLTEIDHAVFTFTSADARFKQVGLFWALRDASGRLVLQQAGQAVFNTDTGEVVKVTPHFNPDFAEVNCTALGGNPA